MKYDLDDELECIDCGWKGDGAELVNGVCPECGGEELEVVYDARIP